MDLSYILNSPDVERVAGALETIADKSIETMNGKLDKNLGSGNAGKALVVGSDGNVALGDTALSDDLKAALIQLAQKVVYTDANGQQYYNALYEALYNAPAPSPTPGPGEWGYTLTTDDLKLGSYFSARPESDGSYFFDGGTLDRICYVPFDIDVEPGYRYIFTWESTSPVMLSPIIYTEALMTIINKQQTIPDYSNAIYTFGWNSGNQLTITPDAMHNGSPISKMRFNFKDPNDRSFTTNVVTSVTIRREAV